MYEIINTCEEQVIEENDIKKVIDIALQKEKLKKVSFNIILVDNEYIHQLNKKYRKVNRETDVITFALEDAEDEMKLPIRMLGDIYISLEKAKEQAKEYGHSLQRELCFLAVHGFYHLLGYDHMTKEEEKVMFSKQEEVLNEAQIRR